MKKIILFIFLFTASSLSFGFDKSEFVDDIEYAKSFARNGNLNRAISEWSSKKDVYGGSDGRFEYELGVLYHLSGQFNAAEEIFISGINLTSKYPRLYTGLASTYLQQEKVKEARFWADKAISEYPNWPVGHAVMGNIEFHSSNYKDSINHAIRSLEVKETPLAYYVYGASSYYLQDYKTTAITINRAIKLDQSYLSEKEAMLMLANSLANIGEYKQAYAALNALAKHNDNINVKDISGNIQEIKELEKAHNTTLN